jgi:hypothetical protein
MPEWVVQAGGLAAGGLMLVVVWMLMRSQSEERTMHHRTIGHISERLSKSIDNNTSTLEKNREVLIEMHATLKHLNGGG